MAVDPRTFDGLPLLERAARCAVGCWFNAEEALCNAIRNARSPDEVFPRGWFRYWGVGRTFRRAGNRDRIRELLCEAIPRLSAPPPAVELVEELSGRVKPLNCGWRPTSLISKFAFSCSPSTIVPYDRLARGQLRTGVHQYLAYAEAFAEKRGSVEQELRTFRRRDRVGLTAKNLPVEGKVMDEGLFAARASDWYLLLEAGYDPIARRNPVYFGPIN